MKILKKNTLNNLERFYDVTLDLPAGFYLLKDENLIVINLAFEKSKKYIYDSFNDMPEKCADIKHFYHDIKLRKTIRKGNFIYSKNEFKNSDLDEILFNFPELFI